MPATLEDIRPEAAQRREDGEFVDLGWRPIFKEHVNSRDFKEPVTFDRASMERIAENCNRRIREDNDFVPICLRHTREDGSYDPEVVGMAGPFRAQKLRSGLWGVFAKWRLYKEDADKSRKYPRVSVEYWASQGNPTDGYFDPVSLLGSETPELDLGVHYQADPRDVNRQLIRYSKVYRFQAAAGGANTFVPAEVEEPKRYQADGGPLGPEAIQQIVAALAPTIKEAVDAAVGAMQPAGADPDHLLTPESEGQESPDGMDGLDGQIGDEVPEEHADAMGPTAEELNFAEPGDEAPGDDDSDLDDMPAGDDDDTDMESAEVDDETSGGLKPQKPAQYSAAGRESETLFFEETDMAADANEVVARYQKEAADYRKKHDDLVVRYQKVETENTALKTENNALKAEKAKAVRYQKLSAVQGEGYTFDIDSEMKDCEELNDAQFDRHIDRIKANYQRVPGTLGSSGLKVAGPSRTDRDDRNDAKKRARYAKVATENCLKANRSPDPSNHLEFKAEFERLMDADPEKIGSQAA